MHSVVAYVSGHGFGHAARVCEVLTALRVRRPDVRVMVRSPLARWFFAVNLDADVEYAACRLDVGVVQPDSLTVDLDATCAAYASIDAQRAALIDAEVAALASHGPVVVLADIPALAFEIAARLAVPGVAMTNFSWDWIYADYAAAQPGFAPLVEHLRAAYARATLLLRLPLHGDLSAFPHVRDVPLVARRARLERDTVRQRLGLPRAARVVLLSFGGIGLQLARVPEIRGVVFVSSGGAALDRAPDGCRRLDQSALTRAGLRYEDLVGAVDALIGKPGYGIVAECIANRTPMLYTPRGRFAEYECLVDGIRAHLAHAELSNADLYAGRWADALERVWSQAIPTPTIGIDGASVVSAVLDAMIG